MSKDRGRNDERNRIAHLAARIMVEDGVEDYATAKRKAARQAGASEKCQLPTNDQIDVALRTHQALFEGDTHTTRVRALRERALEVMRDLERFNPYLTGSVLTGSAGKFADIKILLFAESIKSVEIYFIDRGLAYRAGQTRLYCGEEARTVATFILDDALVDIEIIVLALDDLRQPIRMTPGGKAIERARIQAVESLLATP